MDIFKRTREDQIEFDKFTEKVDRIYEGLIEFEKEIDLYDIKSIKKNFITKTDDFFREDRKLNIGIIGRVKVGKSTFLNSLLFNGKDVLPTAVTPKTASLTKIEYDDENRAEIEYYTEEEWDILKKKSIVESTANEFAVAKEIIRMVHEKNIEPEHYIKKKIETIRFKSYEDMSKTLNDYVGENGKITPLVKSVCLYINKEELEDISVVDTPGLYDPILSRVDKTKQFMELCDVVFFVSKSTSFLDKNDIDLMAAQLPKKGVKKIVLICSRFDDGLRDTLWNKTSLQEAIKDTKQKLLSYTNRAFDDYRDNNYYVNDEIIEQCKRPIFVSALAANMANKKIEEYNAKERKIFKDLSIHKEITRDELMSIGNLDEVQSIFEEVIKEKERMLEEKSSTFVPIAKEELADKLTRIEKLADKRINQLNNYDREKLLEQKKLIGSQINNMNVNLETIFNELCDKVEQNKVVAISEIRAFNREYLQVLEKEGVTTHFEVRKESKTIWFKPWTWGTNTRVIYSYDEKYKYLDAYDAIENIRNFVEDGKSSIEIAFNKSLDIVALKHQLLSVIIENLDALGDSFDASYYRLLVERTVQGLKVPQIQFATDSFEDIITVEFNGEIKGNSLKSNFKKALSDTIYDLREKICMKLESEVQRFIDVIEGLKVTFTEKLLEDINVELNIVIEQYEHKEEEVRIYNKLIAAIRKIEV